MLRKWPQLSFVPRQTRASHPKVVPLSDEQQTKTESLPTENNVILPSIWNSSRINSPIHSSTQASPRISTPQTTRSDETKTNSDTTQHNVTSHKQKTIVRVIAVTAIVLVCATAAILPPIFLIVLRSSSSSSFTNISVSTCSSQTCIGSETPFRTSMITVLYPFYGNTMDLSGSFSGTALGLTSPIYTLSWTSTDSLAFTSANQQYVSIPYVNLAKQSFTLQMWLYPISSGQVDYGVFGQCGSDLICLSLSIRNAHLTLSFDSLNINGSKLTGTTVINNNNWVHVTVVYDAVNFQQMFYVNGLIDALSTGIVYPYQGTSTGATTTIAVASSLGYQPSFFNGNINLFTISAGVVRSACQVYNDATLTTYYPFDTTATLADHGVNLFNGYASDFTMTSSGRVQQAISFSQATSCFQAQCFTSTHVTNPPFSVSLWIYPTVVSGGSIVHVSTNQQGNGSICFDLLAFTSVGTVVAQLYQTLASTVVVNGPNITINTWTHLAVIYSSSNGFRLFVNGQEYFTSTNTAVIWPNTNINPLYVILGNNSPLGPTATLNCPSSSLLAVSGSYKGAIDEFRLYNRELNSQEICVLANP